MTPHETCRAIYAIAGPITVTPNDCGDWSVSAYGLETKSAPESHILSSSFGRGPSFEDAVRDYWGHLTRGIVVVRAMDRVRRRELRWNGFMWVDVVGRYAPAEDQGIST